MIKLDLVEHMGNSQMSHNPLINCFTDKMANEVEGNSVSNEIQVVSKRDESNLVFTLKYFGLQDS